MLFRSDRLLCVGPEIYDAARARLAPSNRTMLFPNGIDFNRFLLALVPKPAALVRHGPHSAELVFVSTVDRDELLRN